MIAMAAVVAAAIVVLQPAPPPLPPGADAAVRTIDQAGAALGRLASSGIEDAVLLGIPIPAERARAAAVADQVLPLLDRAEALAAAEVARLEDGLIGGHHARPGPAQQDDAAEAALARLVDLEQAQRLPFLRGWALTLRAAAGESAARAESARQAVALLAPLRLAGSAEPARRVLLAAAVLNAAPAGTIDTARLDALAADLPGPDPSGAEPAIDPRTRHRLDLLRLVVDAAAGRPAPDPDGQARRQAVARGLLIAARRAPADAPDLVGRACRLLLPPQPAAADAADDASRLDAYARVAAIVGPGLPPGVDTSRLPPETALARAVTLLREHPDSVEARALLTHLAARADAPDDLRATALWEIAAAHIRDPDGHARAAEALRRFITVHPRDPRAVPAAATLERLADQLARAAAADDPARRDQWTDARLQALDILIGSATDPADVRRARWKSAALAIRAARLAPADATPAALLPLVELDASIPAATPAHPGRAALLALFGAIIDDAGFERRAAAQRLDLADVMRRVPAPALAPRLVLIAAEAALTLDLPQRAGDDLRTLIGGPSDQPDHPLRPRIRLALVAALRAREPLPEPRRIEALTLLRELTAPLDRDTTAGTRPDWYWRAWADTLELIAGDARAAADPDTLRAQIRRLELIDPALGGPDTAARFAALRRRAEASAP